MKRLLLLILFSWIQTGKAQNGETFRNADSSLVTITAIRDTALSAGSLDSTAPASKKNDPLRQLLADNYLITDISAGASHPAAQRRNAGDEFNFYYLLGLFAFAGILRAVYPRYFANMFRVFF